MWLAVLQVSELLGSFGDNELCPECLDGAAGLLRPGGVSIPAAYTSFLAPVSAHTVYSTLRHMPSPDRFETPMVVRLWKHVPLAAPQPVFSFAHPRGCAPRCAVRCAVRRAARCAVPYGGRVWPVAIDAASGCVACGAGAGQKVRFAPASVHVSRVASAASRASSADSDAVPGAAGSLLRWSLRRSWSTLMCLENPAAVM